MIIPYSIGGSNTLVGKSWYHLYWEKNALGFRDPEPEKIYDHSKKNLVILGDSFAAGQGIKDPENRFVNLLRTRFNNDFNVFCVSKLGANTPEAISFLKVFPYSPDVVILAHTPNDIQRVVSKDRISALKGDTLNVSKIPMPKPATHYFTEHAFSINLFSFILFLKKQRDQYARSAQGGQGLEIFFQNKANRYNYLGYYLEPELIDLHLSNIISLRTLYPETKLIVLLFPNLNEITIDYSDRNVNQSIIKALAATDIASINLTPLISFLPEKQRIVNKYNFHPSEAIHKMVADTLGTFLTLQKKE
ncbi:MAG: SGNH/GDSL hydrolase family protein [Bacteroidota bacterium]